MHGLQTLFSGRAGRTGQRASFRPRRALLFAFATLITAGTAYAASSVGINVPQPGNVLSGTVDLWGWALYDTTAVSGVSITMGASNGTAYYGDPRADMCSIYPTWVGCNAGSNNVGWDWNVDTSTFAQGPGQTVTATAGPLGASTQNTGVIVDQGPTVSGTTPSGNPTETFTITVNSSVDLQYLTWINGWIAPSLGTSPGCVFTYYPQSGTIALLDDSGTYWLPGAVIGSSDPNPSNSQCTINLMGSSYSGSYQMSGPTGTLNLSVTFDSTFAGTQQVWFTASDQWLASNWTYAGTWTSPLTILTTTLPGGAPGVSYSQTLGATGGTPPYTWSLSSGSLPPGLSLSTSGLLSGTPTSQGTFTFVIQAHDSAGESASQQFNLPITPPSPPSVTIYYPYSGSVISGNLLIYGSAIDNATPINNVQILLGSTQLANLPGNGNTGYTIYSSFETDPADNPNPPIPQGPNKTITVNATDQDSPPLTGSAEVTVTIDQPPTISLSATPRAGNGSGIFSFTVTTSTGMANELWINGMIAPYLGGQPMCSFSYWPGSGTFALMNDAGTQWQYGVLYSGLSNSQCAINPDSTYVQSADGLSGTLNLDIIFQAGLQGTEEIWMITSDNWLSSNQVYGGPWTTIPGQLTITTPTALPNAASGQAYSQNLGAGGGHPPYSWSQLTPPVWPSLSASGQLNGTAPSGNSITTLQAQVTDSLGATAQQAFDLATVDPNNPPTPGPPTVTFFSLPGNGAIAGNSTVIWGQVSDNTMPIISMEFSDGTTQLPVSFANDLETDGQQDTIQSCTKLVCWWWVPVDTTKLTQGNGQILTVSAIDKALQNSLPAQQITMVVEQPPVPSLNIGTPTGSNSGTGASGTFYFNAFTSSGAGNITYIYAWIAAQGTQPPSCSFYFNPSGGTISLSDDVGGFLSPAIIGSSTDPNPSNSECNVNLASSSFTASPGSDVASLKLSLSFTAAFAGEKAVTMFVSDIYMNSGWLLPQVGTWTVTPPVDFTTGAPSQASIEAYPTGSPSGSLTEVITGVNYAGPINLSYSVSPTPTHGSLTFSPSSITSPGSFTIAATAAAGTNAGTYNVNVVASIPNTTTSHSFAIAVVVTGPPTITISQSPSPIVVAPGNTVSFTETVSAVNGFTGVVEFVQSPTSGVWPGQLNFSNATLTAASPVQTVTGTITIYANATPQSAAYTYPVYAISNELPTQGLQLGILMQVTAGPTFTVTPTSGPITLYINANGTVASTPVKVTVNPVGGFTGPVTFSAQEAQAFVASGTGTVNSNAPINVQINVQATASATPSSTPVPINIMANSELALTLQAIVQPPYTVTSNVTSLDIASNGSATLTGCVSPQGGYSGTVNVTATGLPTGVTASTVGLPISGTSCVPYTNLNLTSSSASGSAVSSVGIGAVAQPVTVNVTPDFTHVPFSGSVQVGVGGQKSFGLTFTVGSSPITVTFQPCYVTPPIVPGDEDTQNMATTIQNMAICNASGSEAFGVSSATLVGSGGSYTIPANSAGTYHVQRDRTS